MTKIKIGIILVLLKNTHIQRKPTAIYSEKIKKPQDIVVFSGTPDGNRTHN